MQTAQCSGRLEFSQQVLVLIMMDLGVCRFFRAAMFVCGPKR